MIYIVNDNYTGKEMVGALVENNGSAYRAITKRHVYKNIPDNLSFSKHQLTPIPEELQNEPIEVIKLWASL